MSRLRTCHWPLSRLVCGLAFARPQLFGYNSGYKQNQNVVSCIVAKVYSTVLVAHLFDFFHHLGFLQMGSHDIWGMELKKSVFHEIWNARACYTSLGSGVLTINFWYLSISSNLITFCLPGNLNLALLKASIAEALFPSFVLTDMMTCPMFTRATVPWGLPKAPRIPVWSLQLTITKHSVSIIIQQIVTLSKYGHHELNICRPYSTDILRYM